MTAPDQLAKENDWLDVLVSLLPLILQILAVIRGRGTPFPPIPPTLRQSLDDVSRELSVYYQNGCYARR